MAASFAEVLMNPEYSPLAKGGPTFQNVIISTINGQISPAVGRYDYISIYKFGYELLTLPEYDALRSFCILRQCGAQGFRFLAPDKNTATLEEITPAIEADVFVYKLVQNYSDGGVFGNAYQRRIIKPYDLTLKFGTFVVDVTPYNSTVEGIPLNGNGLDEVDFTFEFNYMTGTITLSPELAANHAGHSLKWSGSYHLPMIFMDGESLAEFDTTYSRHNDIYIRELLPSALGIT